MSNPLMQVRSQARHFLSVLKAEYHQALAVQSIRETYDTSHPSHQLKERGAVQVKILAQVVELAQAANKLLDSNEAKNANT